MRFQYNVVSLKCQMADPSKLIRVFWWLTTRPCHMGHSKGLLKFLQETDEKERHRHRITKRSEREREGGREKRILKTEAQKWHLMAPHILLQLGDWIKPTLKGGDSTRLWIPGYQEAGIIRNLIIIIIIFKTLLLPRFWLQLAGAKVIRTKKNWWWNSSLFLHPSLYQRGRPAGPRGSGNSSFYIVTQSDLTEICHESLILEFYQYN